MLISPKEWDHELASIRQFCYTIIDDLKYMRIIHAYESITRMLTSLDRLRDLNLH